MKRTFPQDAVTTTSHEIMRGRWEERRKKEREKERKKERKK